MVPVIPTANAQIPVQATLVALALMLTTKMGRKTRFKRDGFVALDGAFLLG